MTSNFPYSGIQILLLYGTKQVPLRWSVIVVGIPVTAGGVVTLTPPATPWIQKYKFKAKNLLQQYAFCVTHIYELD